MSIFDTNDDFDFTKLSLLSPTVIPGGNYFIKFRVNQSPLYIQPPQCKSKQAMIKSGKKIFFDLMFTNEDENFIRWMENLETYCKSTILKNKDKWLETDLDEHDIDNSFTSPLKIFKSGKYYIMRVYVPNHLGVCPVTVYNEYEEEVSIEEIQENTDLKTILEIQGIKCSAKNFQIEIEMKQIMVVKPKNLFNKCLFSTTPPSKTASVSEAPIKSVSLSSDKELHIELEYPKTEDKNELIDSGSVDSIEIPHEDKNTTEKENIDMPADMSADENTWGEETAIKIDTIPEKEMSDELLEVEFDLEKIPETETIELVPTNDIYYKMYKDAKRRAKAARDLAISSYMEAMRIKNTHLLDDLEDDDSDSDLDETMEELEKM